MAHSLKKRTTIETYRCRKCGLPKKPDDYFKATDLELDSNEKMSVCKNCCRELLDKQMEIQGSMEKAFLVLCRRLNIVYDESAIQKTLGKMDELKKEGKPLDILFGFYLQTIHSTRNSNTSLMFRELEAPIAIREEDAGDRNIDIKKMEKDWGKGLSLEDYTYLEEELAEWEATHRSDTKAEQTLLQQIALKQLEIRKARLVNPLDTDLSASLLKQLQDLMKTAAIDPSKANAAGQGKNMESFSAFIAMIEKTEPAEYYGDKDLFKDFDNIGNYFKTYVTRPLKNFVMGSRDFNIETEQDGDDEDDSFDISDMGIDEEIPEIKEEEKKKEE